MSLPSNFVKQIYDIAKPKGYALSDSFFVDKLYGVIKEYKITKVVEAGTYQGRLYCGLKKGSLMENEIRNLTVCPYKPKKRGKR